jgi:hypothetical protein
MERYSVVRGESPLLIYGYNSLKVFYCPSIWGCGATPFKELNIFIYDYYDLVLPMGGVGCSQLKKTNLSVDGFLVT